MINFGTQLAARAAAGQPIRVGLIGAGKFTAMYLAQALTTPGIHILGVADLDRKRAEESFRRAGWPAERFAPDFATALESGATVLTEDAHALIAAPGLDIVVEATGQPRAAAEHCLAAIAARRHVIMVSVEADVVAGPLLAARARENGVLYSLAYGDQPAIICEHVEWARSAGFTVVAAGKGTRYLPHFHHSTPDTVWENFGISAELARRVGNNPKMFNSFIDGSKSAIEMTAVCNATGLTPQPGGLGFPPASIYELASVCKPKSAGGTLSHEGTTEVVSSLRRDGKPVPHHLQIGTYVIVKANNEFVRDCIREYGFYPDESGYYAALFRPVHMIGFELGISVASLVFHNEPTGAPRAFLSDVAAIAKRDLAAGEILDGEGGYTVWGKQIPAAASLAAGALPLGLAHGVRLLRPKKAGEMLSYADVALDPADPLLRLRREMESRFAPPPAVPAAHSSAAAMPA
jgi:predicted homoserine dehydrogenase-like protein